MILVTIRYTIYGFELSCDKNPSGTLNKTNDAKFQISNSLTIHTCFRLRNTSNQ